MSMHTFLSPKRSMLLACVVSVLGAGVMIWVFAPGLFAGLRTSELLIVVGLLTLPGPTCWAIWHEAVQRREAAHRRTLGTHTPGLQAQGSASAAGYPHHTHEAEPPPRNPPGHAGAQPGRPPAKRVLHEPAYSGDPRQRV